MLKLLDFMDKSGDDYASTNKVNMNWLQSFCPGLNVNWLQLNATSPSAPCIQ